MNKLQFSLFTLLQESFQEDGMPDFSRSSERIESYLLQRFREIYRNVSVSEEGDVLRVQINNSSKSRSDQTKDNKNKVYVDFRIELDEKTLTEIEENLKREERSLEDNEELYNLTPPLLLDLITTQAAPNCSDKPKCPDCKRVEEIMKSMKELLQKPTA